MNQPYPQYPQGWPDQRYPAMPGPPGHPQWAPGAGPVFAVRLMRHTGMLVLFSNSRFTVTGSYQQCETAIREVQTHNLLAGWWSPLSLLLNPIALLSNLAEQQRLQREAGLR